LARTYSNNLKGSPNIVCPALFLADCSKGTSKLLNINKVYNSYVSFIYQPPKSFIMKKGTFALLIMHLVIGAFCQDNLEEEQEKKAIIKTLYEEGTRFSAFDMEGISALHITDESAARYDGTKLYTGWDEIDSLYQFYIQRNKKFNDEYVKNGKENIVIKVLGNNAWVICDNIWKWETKGEAHSSKNLQIAYLEKQDGKWKFAFNAFVSEPRPSNHDLAKKNVSLLADKFAKAMKQMDVDMLKSTLAEDGLFCGTDPTEVFDKESFMERFEPPMALEEGFVFTTERREISLSSNGKSAIVTEQLTYPAWSPNMPIRQTFHAVLEGIDWKFDYIGWSFLVNNGDVEEVNKVLE